MALPRPKPTDPKRPAAAAAPPMAPALNGDHHHQPPPPRDREQPPSYQPLPPPPREHRPSYLPPPPRQRHYMVGIPSSSSSSSSASLKGCCCCLFLLLTFLALLVVAVVLVIVLAVKPKKPQFDLQQASVQYLLIPDPTAPTISLNITLLFAAENPNKVGIRYAPASFYVMYRGVPLGLATVPGFEQPAHSTRLVQTRVTVARFNVLQADALDLVRDAAAADRVELRITGDVAAKIRLLGLTSPRVQVSVDCAIVISPRKQSVTYKQCGVDGVNF